MVDPAVQMCETAAEEKRRLRGRWDREVFGINCVTYLQSVLEPFSFTTAKQRTIEDLMNQQVKLLGRCICCGRFLALRKRRWRCRLTIIVKWFITLPEKAQ